jgi:GT2 family glycosyltransferase
MAAPHPNDFSVVIPVGNGSRQAVAVARAALSADPPPGEVILVNDRVTDMSLADLPTDARLRVIANGGPPGPAAARNSGARAASRPYVLFVDADVFVPPDIFGRLATAFMEEIDAVGGVEAEARGGNLATRYKNLWMRYTYLKLPRRVELFYTSCAAVKRDLFLRVGGLDEGYRCPSVEDTAFGRTLAAAGGRVILEKEIEVEHRKAYNARGLLRITFKRAVAMSRLVLRLGRRSGGNRTSIPTSFILALPLGALLPGWFGVAPFAPAIAAAGWTATHIAIYALNARWLMYLARRGFALLAFGLAFLPLELGLGFWGGAWGTASYYLAARKY